MVLAAFGVSTLAPRAFISSGCGQAQSRRAAWAALAPALAPLAGSGKARAEFVPPLKKAVKFYHDKVQGATDWMFFELKESLKTKDRYEIGKKTGAATSGNYVAPYETDLVFPLGQFVEENPESDELGWTADFTRIQDGLANMKARVQKDDFPAALDEFENVRQGMEDLYKKINELGEYEVFIVPTKEYEQARKEVWQKTVSDKLAYRNQMGSIMMR